MTIRIPVAIWQDPQGTFTATTLDGLIASAIDVSASDVLRQLKQYVVWHTRRHPHLNVDFDELEVREHRVSLRGAYRVHESRYPVANSHMMRIAGIHGKRSDGSFHCVIPTLSIRLTYQPDDPIETLVAESVQELLGDKTPQELSRELMPRSIAVSAIHVPNPKGRRTESGEHETALAAVAERIGRRRRGRFNSPIVLRSNEIRLVAERLSSHCAGVLLVGDEGVGKSTVLIGAIRQLRHQRRLQSKNQNAEAIPRQRVASDQFWKTTGASLLAGMKYLGEWEERCERVVAALGEVEGVLCVENLLELITSGGRGPEASVAAFLLPYLRRSELRMVAEATVAELDACRQRLPALVDEFQIVRIPDLSAAESRELLHQLLSQGGVDLDENVAGTIYRLFKRFQPYAAFPGRTVAFVQQLIDDASRRSTKRISQLDVVVRFQKETGLPEPLLRDDMVLPPDQVLDHFRSVILGQDDACRAATNVVTTLKSGLNDPVRPLGVLLFCGPTGVGKTEMAKELSRYLFGTGREKDRLIRLDMSEYSGAGAADRLFQNGDGGLSDFLQRVRHQPFVVVLLDEVEKAAPEVLDALLGVLDEGRLTDRLGRTTTFRSAVIIMTSNLGADRGGALGFDDSAVPSFERIVLKSFRPEFYNRIDSVVVFRPLERDAIRSLASRELQSITTRDGMGKYQLRLTWDESVVDHLVNVGYDARLGARPLQRAIEREVVGPLSEWLLRHAHQLQQSSQERRLTLRFDATCQRVLIEKTD